MFVASCYFTYNACRDTATERELDIVIQMTLEHVLVQRFKKKEMDEKNNFWQRYVNVTKRANSSRIIV